MTARFERRTGIEAGLRIGEERLELPSGVPLVAYRTAQEALTNVSKHSQATKVGIELSLDSGVLTLEICDNGKGIAAGDLAKERSFGIRGLHERAATVGGWVDLSSTPGHGTSLILTVPLAQDAIDALDDATDFGKDVGNSIWGRA
jgi:signal transduction histidine kinase